MNYRVDMVSGDKQPGKARLAVTREEGEALRG